jgi:hypothetical protein
MAEKMEDLDFEFEIIPGGSSIMPMTLVDKPMSFETDEIKLR